MNNIISLEQYLTLLGFSLNYLLFKLALQFGDKYRMAQKTNNLKTCLSKDLLLLLPCDATRRKYDLQMRKRINFLGFFLLILRLANIMFRVLNYEAISECVQSPQFLLLGIGVQIIAQLLSLKWMWAMKTLSFIVVLSFLNMRFCEHMLDNESDMAVMVDTLIFDIFSTLLLSYSWVLTVVASLILKASLYEMFTVTENLTYKLIMYPLSLCQIVQFATIYLIEKDRKQSFLRQLEAKEKERSLRAILNSMYQVIAVFQNTSVLKSDKIIQDSAQDQTFHTNGPFNPESHANDVIESKRFRLLFKNRFLSFLATLPRQLSVKQVEGDVETDPADVPLFQEIIIDKQNSSHSIYGGVESSLQHDGELGHSASLKQLKLDHRVNTLRQIITLPNMRSRLFMLSERARKGPVVAFLNNHQVAHGDIYLTDEKSQDQESSSSNQERQDAELQKMRFAVQEDAVLQVTSQVIEFEGEEANLITMQKVNTDELAQMGLIYTKEGRNSGKNLDALRTVIESFRKEIKQKRQ
ncbi:hypothetical protein FGO68_gene1486 [Halteria grandinella]|uniref:Uncharacterized protein n=1 Tax=Halteria grandinella TaxID=5974 RepID=A0A8J8T3K8_HALGN|nr:hypothetical protein FGO68_gene1486 [Halteria grandinella]